MRVLVRELFETAILALLIFIALHLSIQNYRVQGPSMLPTLDEGQYLMVNKLVYLRVDPNGVARLLPWMDVDEKASLFPFHPPTAGEVIIFQFPGDPSRDFVKRVIGVPGDTVEIRDGQVLLNGQDLKEPYITNHGSTNMRATTVGPDTYFVLGDNRQASNDSRDWGAVPGNNVIGRAWVSFWPLDQWQSLVSWVPIN